MIRFFKFSFILYMLMGLTSINVLACECIPTTDQMAEKSFTEADLVVKATLVSPSPGWGSNSGLVRVHIEEVIKGEEDLPEIITVNYNSNSAVCGHEFTEGQKGIFAMYDTRSIGLTNEGNRGYGFRMLVSCDQVNVRHHVDKMISESQLP